MGELSPQVIDLGLVLGLVCCKLLDLDSQVVDFLLEDGDLLLVLGDFGLENVDLLDVTALFLLDC